MSVSSIADKFNQMLNEDSKRYRYVELSLCDDGQHYRYTSGDHVMKMKIGGFDSIKDVPTVHKKYECLLYGCNIGCKPLPAVYPSTLLKFDISKGCSTGFVGKVDLGEYPNRYVYSDVSFGFILMEVFKAKEFPVMLDKHLGEQYLKKIKRSDNFVGTCDAIFSYARYEKDDDLKIFAFVYGYYEVVLYTKPPLYTIFCKVLNHSKMYHDHKNDESRYTIRDGCQDEIPGIKWPELDDPVLDDPKLNVRAAVINLLKYIRENSIPVLVGCVYMLMPKSQVS
jgi:hypothetical protein